MTASTSNVAPAVALRAPLASPLLAVQLTALAPVTAVGIVHVVVPEPLVLPELSTGVIAPPLSVQLREASPDGPTDTSSVSAPCDVQPLGGLFQVICGAASSTLMVSAVATVGDPDAL